MKLLITTQTVDRKDPYLGFFHEWLVALSNEFETIETICLKEGEHMLPSNVHIHSLGKEHGGGKLSYVARFLALIKKLRTSYDAVFVHMNPEYVILGSVFWKLWGKKIYLWYNHPKAGLRLSLAIALADKVFHTSPLAASAGTKKSVRMPAGIDTEVFVSKGLERKKHSIYLQGRVMPSKRVNAACEAVDLLVERGLPVTLSIVGPEDPDYGKELRRRYKGLIDAGAVVFLGPKPNTETPALYGTHGVALNLASGGHYDKTVLEAMACETPVIITSQAFKGRVPDAFMEKETPLQFADALEAFFALTEEEQRALGKKERQAVIDKESLPALISMLSKELTS